MRKSWLLLAAVTLTMGCAQSARYGMVEDPETGLMLGSAVERNIVIDASEFENRTINLNLRNASGDPSDDLTRFREHLLQALRAKGYTPTDGDDFGVNGGLHGRGVDDDEAVRESLRKLLHGEGYQVIAVANGVEAVETFRQEVDQIDLLLVDLNMPMKNGWATLDRFIEVNPSLPVVIVTGSATADTTAEIIRRGAVGCLPKPFTPDELGRRVREVLDRRVLVG